MNSAAWNFARLPKTYAGLVALHMPRPIHDKVAYDNAVEVVRALAGHKLNRDQDDYLALMAKLVEDYESENVAEPKPVKGIEALKFLLEENSLTAADLGEIIGVNRSIAYRILKGARNLTADHVKKLAARFAVSADLFLA
ncbi:MAG: helix-turn-helix domain-containing protein [Verrucomicrobiota bacterium]